MTVTLILMIGGCGEKDDREPEAATSTPETTVADQQTADGGGEAEPDDGREVGPERPSGRDEASSRRRGAGGQDEPRGGDRPHRGGNAGEAAQEPEPDDDFAETTAEQLCADAAGSTPEADAGCDAAREAAQASAESSEVQQAYEEGKSEADG